MTVPCFLLASTQSQCQSPRVTVTAHTQPEIPNARYGPSCRLPQTDEVTLLLHVHPDSTLSTTRPHAATWRSCHHSLERQWPRARHPLDSRFARAPPTPAKPLSPSLELGQTNNEPKLNIYSQNNPKWINSQNYPNLIFTLEKQMHRKYQWTR